jgi:hypothetical protein
VKAIYYAVEEHCGSTHQFEVADRTDITRPIEQAYIAERCAEHYWGEHDGWEANWPLTFTLHETEDGPEVGRMIVDMEPVPHFTAAIPRKGASK